MQINLGAINSGLLLISLLILLTIFLKQILTMAVISFFGYMKKPSFFTSISLAQASEFSLILVVLGLSLGHVNNSFFSAVIFVTIATMAFTPYLIEYQNWFYNKMSSLMIPFEHFIKKVPIMPAWTAQAFIVVCGKEK